MSAGVNRNVKKQYCNTEVNWFNSKWSTFPAACWEWSMADWHQQKLYCVGWKQLNSMDNYGQTSRSLPFSVLFTKLFRKEKQQQQPNKKYHHQQKILSI